MLSNTQKLRILRARTDHDLLVVVSRELDRGLALVDSATSRNSPVFAQAVKAQSCGHDWSGCLSMQTCGHSGRRSHRKLHRPIVYSGVPENSVHFPINLNRNLTTRTPTAPTDVRSHGGHEAKKLI